MGTKSSANFKKSKAWQIYHNSDIRPSYAIGGGLECNRNATEALTLKNQIIQEAKETYERNRKPKAPKFKATSYEWSLVVNLKESSTMQDLEKLSKHFSDKYGFQCYQIAIHRDEGHINEQGEKIINHHAHLEFITLDRETGKNRFRGEFVTATGLRIVQDEVAEILQMERGVDKRLSGAKRIEPRAYGAMKEKEKLERAELVQKNKILKTEAFLAKKDALEYQQVNDGLKYTNERLRGENEDLKREILTQKQINERFSAERKVMIERGGHTQEGYKAMTALKNELKAQQITNQQLENAIRQLRDELEKEREERLKAEKIAEEKENKIQELQAEIQRVQVETLKAHKAREKEHSTQTQEPQNDFKTIAEKDFKIILGELKLGVKYGFDEEVEAIYTNSMLNLATAKQARDKLEQKGYYVQITANNSIYHTENRIALAFAKTRKSFKEICEKMSRWWRSIYETSDEKLRDMQRKYDLQNKEAKTETNNTIKNLESSTIWKILEENQKKINAMPREKDILQPTTTPREQAIAETKEHVKESAKKIQKTYKKSNDFEFER